MNDYRGVEKIREWYMKPYYEHAGITIYHGDCRDVLPSLTGRYFCWTDPPYYSSLERIHL